MRRFLLVSLLSLLTATSVAAQVAPKIKALVSPVTVRLRGLSAVDENIAWASGREGTVIRTIDGGKTWAVFKVSGAEKLDFRDVEGFSADEAVILSIGPGEDSRIYRTTDGGKTWLLALQNTNPDAFFDCFSFDGAEGRLLGDPINGRFQVLRTSDGGMTWSSMVGPTAERDEAAFAASGTCILHKGRITAIASGGAAPRAHWLFEGQGDSSAHWLASEVLEDPKLPSSGYFSVAEAGNGFVLVGGDYKQEQSTGVALGLDRGVVGDTAITDRKLPAPPGYRSGMNCLPNQAVCVATGPAGSDIWDGKFWAPVQGLGYDSVDSAGRIFWFSGDGGRLGRLVLPE